MVVNAAKAAKGIMQVGFQLRFDPKINASEKFIQSGGSARSSCATACATAATCLAIFPGISTRPSAGDIMVDQGIHILDLFTWAIGTHPLRAYGSGGTNLFVNDPPGRTVMDNYYVIFEYPDARVNLSHHYLDPPGFSGHQVRVFGSEGAVDVYGAAWQPREKKGPVIPIEVPEADKDKDSTYMSLAAYIENVRLKRKPPINNVESAMQSTLVPLMGTKSIYEKRIVTWEEMAG